MGNASCSAFLFGYLTYSIFSQFCRAMVPTVNLKRTSAKKFQMITEFNMGQLNEVERSQQKHNDRADSVWREAEQIKEGIRASQRDAIMMAPSYSEDEETPPR